MPDRGYNVIGEVRRLRSPRNNRRWPASGKGKKQNQKRAVYAKPMPCCGYIIVGKKVQSRRADLRLGLDLSAALASFQTLLERHRRTEC